MPKLINASEMPKISNIKVPTDFYWVLSDATPLAGMRYPSPGLTWNHIAKAGFRYVICLTDNNPKYDPSPLTVAHATKLEDPLSGNSPANPEREEALIRECVQTTMSKLEEGDGIVLHCAGGRGRTGTVIGCVLRELGFSSPEILTCLDQLNKDRGKLGWPESNWQAKLVERFR